MTIQRISRQAGGVRFDLFLDRGKVMRALDRKSRRVLRGAGGAAKTTARRSMRKAGKRAGTKTSQPGKSPRYHTRLLKDNIFFWYDPRRKRVDIGPIKFKRSTVKPFRVKTGAALLEVGGKARLIVRARPGQAKQRYKATYRKRPYMKPAQAVGIAEMRKLMRTIPLRG